MLGDYGYGGDDQYNVAKKIIDWSPDLVVHTGDVVYPRGADKDYDDAFFAPYKDIISRKPLFAAPGNHDSYNMDVFEQIFYFLTVRSVQNQKIARCVWVSIVFLR